MIDVRPKTEVVRCYSKGDGYLQRSPYRCMLYLDYLPNNLAIAYGAIGKLSKRDIYRIYKHLHMAGVQYLIADRGECHSIPGGRVITEGEFAGLHKVDLNEAVR